MKFLIFIPPRNFKDESLSMVEMFFKRWGIEYDVTSYSAKQCSGAHGASRTTDVNINEITSSNYDGIFLLDGAGIDEYRLHEYRPLLDLVFKFNASGKKVAAISNSVKIAAKANIIRGRKVSVPPDEESKRAILLFHGVPSENDIEMDGNLITVRSSSRLENSIHAMLQGIGAI